MVVHTLNPSTLNPRRQRQVYLCNVEAIQLYIVPHQPGIPTLHSEILSQKKIVAINKKGMGHSGSYP